MYRCPHGDKVCCRLNDGGRQKGRAQTLPRISTFRNKQRARFTVSVAFGVEDKLSGRQDTFRQWPFGDWATLLVCPDRSILKQEMLQSKKDGISEIPFVASCRECDEICCISWWIKGHDAITVAVTSRQLKNRERRCSCSEAENKNVTQLPFRAIFLVIQQTQ